VKCKIELLLHPRWFVLRENAFHVALLSKQNTLSIQRNIIFSTCGNVDLQVHCKSLNIRPYLEGVQAAFSLSQDNVNEFVHRVIAVVDKIRGLEICAGYDEEKFKSCWQSCQLGEVDCNPFQECRYVETLRSKSCQQLVPRSTWRCKECTKLYKPLQRKAATVSKEEPKPNTGNKYLTEEQKLWKLKEQQKALKSARKKISRLEGCKIC